jgi:hypothetical protein
MKVNVHCFVGLYGSREILSLKSDPPWLQGRMPSLQDEPPWLQSEPPCLQEDPLWRGVSFYAPLRTITTPVRTLMAPFLQTYTLGFRVSFQSSSVSFHCSRVSPHYSG